MIPFLLGLTVGIIQFFLLKAVLNAIMKNCTTKKTVIYIVLKFLLYAAACAVVLTVFRQSIATAGIGLAAGMPGCAAVYAIRMLCFSKKGDDSGEHGDNN